jgi:hypothetical protein
LGGTATGARGGQSPTAPAHPKGMLWAFKFSRLLKSSKDKKIMFAYGKYVDYHGNS